MTFMEKLQQNYKNGKPRRVFFAIVPDGKALNEIHDLQFSHKNLNARLIKRDNMHLTLLFLGNLNKEQLDCVLTSTKSVQHQRLNLNFDRSGVFKKAHIWWLGQHETDNHLYELHETLNVVANDCGILTEKRKFKPHITLARKFSNREFPQLTQTIRIKANHFCLMESIPVEKGVRYETLETYALS